MIRRPPRSTLDRRRQRQMCIRDRNVYTTDTGTYYIFLKGANGCLNVDTIHVDDDPLHPVFSLSTDTITCYVPLVPIVIHYADTLEQYEWTGPSGFMNDEAVVNISEGGMYYLTGYGENGCSTMDSVLVPMDTYLPVAVITVTDSIVCEHSVIDRYGNIPPLGQNYSYQWTSLAGEITSNDRDTNILIRGPGLYTLTTQDLNNGCIYTINKEVVEIPNPINEIIVDIDNTSCKELTNGVIRVISVPNAIGALKYSICLLYTSDAADERSSVDLGGRRIITKKKR